MGALPAVAFHTLLRAALAGVGLYVAGVRQNLVRYSIAGALGIEAGVLVWAVKNRPTRVQQPTETALEHAG